MKACTCPRRESIPYFQNSDICHNPIGQIKYLAFSRKFKGKESLPCGFDHSIPHNIQSFKSWEDLLSPESTDSIRISPLVNNPTFEGGDPVVYGGGNLTYGGIEYVVGGNPILFSCDFVAMPVEIRTAMKALECYSDNLQVFFITGANQVAYKQAKYWSEDLDLNIVVDSGFHISRMVLTDYAFGALDKPDSFKMSFQLEYDWTTDMTFAALSGGTFDQMRNIKDLQYTSDDDTTGDGDLPIEDNRGINRLRGIRGSSVRDRVKIK